MVIILFKMGTKKKIIIVGAGFSGLKLAQKLNNTEYDIFLIDKHNYHQFQPLLYQVATARLEPSNVSFPLRKVFQKIPNVHIRLAEVKYIDTINKQVHLDHFTMDYDKLVVAMGCDTNYFGNKDLEKYSMPMKSTQEALALRN